MNPIFDVYSKEITRRNNELKREMNEIIKEYEHEIIFNNLFPEDLSKVDIERRKLVALLKGARSLMERNESLESAISLLVEMALQNQTKKQRKKERKI